MFVECRMPKMPSSCLYLFIKKGKVVYVGRTKDFRKRLGQHNIWNAANPDAVLFAEFPGLDSSRLHFAEELLIWSFQPKHNTHLKSADDYGIMQSSVMLPLLMNEKQIENVIDAMRRFGGRVPEWLTRAIDYGLMCRSGMPLFDGLELENAFHNG